MENVDFSAAKPTVAMASSSSPFKDFIVVTASDGGLTSPDAVSLALNLPILDLIACRRAGPGPGAVEGCGRGFVVAGELVAPLAFLVGGGGGTPFESSVVPETPILKFLK